MALMSPLIPEEILNGLILPGYAITQAIVIKKKKDYVPPLLKILHSLPISLRVKAKGLPMA